MTIGKTYSFISNIRNIWYYSTYKECSVYNDTQVLIGGMSYTTAQASDIPVMTHYALLASPNFTGTPTITSLPLLARATTLSPAYYNAGQRIDMDVSALLIRQGWIFILWM